MKASHSKFRVGLLIVLGVVAITLGIFFVGEKSKLFSSAFFVRVNFTSVEGVKPGTLVYLSGYSVGTVADISLVRGDSVRLTLRLEERIRPFIKRDSHARIDQEGLVGNKVISLFTGSAASQPVNDYDFITGVQPYSLADLTADARMLVDTSKYIAGQVKDIFVDVNRGVGTLGLLLKDDAVYRNFEQITMKSDTTLALVNRQLLGLSAILENLTQAVYRLVLRSDSTVMRANEATREVEIFVRKMNEGQGTLGALVTDRSMYDSLNALLGDLQAVSHDASNAADQISKAVYAMRTHWLLGRVFGPLEQVEQEPPASSLNQQWRELRRQERRLQRLLESLRKKGLIDPDSLNLDQEP